MDSLLAIASIGVLVVNLVLISFIYRQVRHIYRPIVTTKVISSEGSVDRTPSVLESGDLYLVVSNVSNNQAKNLKIGCEFWLGGEKIAQVNKLLRYLNPREATKELIPLGKIIDSYPELFEEIEVGKVTKKIPKKTLALLLKITVIHGFPRHKILDSYKIEWDSLETCPRFEDHPLILCWNIRDGLYIYKLSEGSESSG
ncbi:hypothetical protein ES707_22297 [subsurface metagenome]